MIAKYVLIALGLMFILVGMTIAMAGNSEFESTIAPLYGGMVYLFYGFIALVFLWVLITALTAFGQRKR